MPTYAYRCTNPECAHTFDIVQAFTDDALTECPVCGRVVRKVFSPVGVVFKGSGFYRNDSRGKAETSEKASSDAGSKESGSKDSGAKDKGSSDGGPSGSGATDKGTSSSEKGSGSSEKSSSSSDKGSSTTPSSSGSGSAPAKAS